MDRPAYQRITKILKDGILSGKFPTGHKFPPERELAEQFNVSQITIRHALRLLEEHWLVDRRPRRGTIVLPLWPKERLPIELQDFVSSVRRHSPDLKRELISVERIVPYGWVAEELELPAKQRCMLIAHCDVIDSKPLRFGRAYIPISLAETIDQEMLEQVDFRKRWLKKMGKSVARTNTEVVSLACDEECSLRLSSRPGFPMLLLREFPQDRDGNTLAIFESIFRGDRFRLRTSRKGS